MSIDFCGEKCKTSNQVFKDSIFAFIKRKKHLKTCSNNATFKHTLGETRPFGFMAAAKCTEIRKYVVGPLCSTICLYRRIRPVCLYTV